MKHFHSRHRHSHEGSSEIPFMEGCNHRIVLGSETLVPQVAQWMHHPHAISVGSTSFALFMLEIATAEHMVLRREMARLCSFVDCGNWKLLSSDGSLVFLIRNI